MSPAAIASSACDHGRFVPGQAANLSPKRHLAEQLTHLEVRNRLLQEEMRRTESSDSLTGRKQVGQLVVRKRDDGGALSSSPPWKTSRLRAQPLVHARNPVWLRGGGQGASAVKARNWLSRSGMLLAAGRHPLTTICRSPGMKRSNWP